MLVWHTASTFFNTHYHKLMNTASWKVWPPLTTLCDQLWPHVGSTMCVNLTLALALIITALSNIWSHNKVIHNRNPKWTHDALMNDGWMMDGEIWRTHQIKKFLYHILSFLTFWIWDKGLTELQTKFICLPYMQPFLYWVHTLLWPEISM